MMEWATRTWNDLLVYELQIGKGYKGKKRKSNILMI